MNTLKRKTPSFMSAFAVASAMLAAAIGLSAQDKKVTVKDKVYSAEQAAKGEKQFTTVCVNCHDPAKVTPGKKPAPQLIGPKFLDEWSDRTLGELMTTIVTTMPDDGSVVLSEDDGAALVAYILKQNGFPDGPNDLKPGAASKDIVIVK